LAGEPPSATEEPLPAGPDSVRREGATELLRLLRLANAQATAWNRATAAAATAGSLALTPEETELALFLLDEGSITALLGAVDRILAAARDGGRAGPAAKG
jgi:hypothetical protein